MIAGQDSTTTEASLPAYYAIKPYQAAATATMTVTTGMQLLRAMVIKFCSAANVLFPASSSTTEQDSVRLATSQPTATNAHLIPWENPTVLAATGATTSTMALASASPALPRFKVANNAPIVRQLVPTSLAKAASGANT